MDLCDIAKYDCKALDAYITSKNGKASYFECAHYLNNNTNLTQIQINTCLNNVFKNDSNNSNIKWTAIL